MSLEELEDITNLRVVLEGMALTESVENSDDAWESRVVAAFHHLTKAENQTEPGYPGVGIAQPGVPPGAGVLLPLSLADALP